VCVWERKKKSRNKQFLSVFATPHNGLRVCLWDWAIWYLRHGGGVFALLPARHRLPIGIKGILSRVMRIGTTEVKFLDRCGTRGSEGALLDRIRQSRTRVWGSKMIRYRRSPLTVNRASSISMGCSAMGESALLPERCLCVCAVSSCAYMCASVLVGGLLIENRPRRHLTS